MKNYTLQIALGFFALAFLLSCSVNIQEKHLWMIITSLIMFFVILVIDIIINKRFRK